MEEVMTIPNGLSKIEAIVLLMRRESEIVCPAAETVLAAAILKT
jgi:hypothetical protein